MIDYKIDGYFETLNNSMTDCFLLQLSGHLHARDKEREQHRRSEAILAFQALLTDLIKHPDYSWKEAKKVFKKDSR